MCKLRHLGEIESESHFLLYCTNYNDLRGLIFHEMARQNPPSRSGAQMGTN